MAGAYYSEHDPEKAAILRQLIADGCIAPGDVDERSIEDVTPAELMGYAQRHFFAGGGIWSLALRRRGWPDSRPCVTASCPCQPFSAAGKGEGFADERHLWPALYWHLEHGASVPVFGEQVASDDGLAWLDAVHADLDHAGYTLGVLDSCAAGYGAPHIRQRLYWMAHPERAERHARPDGPCVAARAHDQSSGRSLTRGMAHAALPGLGTSGRSGGDRAGHPRAYVAHDDTTRGMAHAGGKRRQQNTGGSLGDEAEDGRAGWNGCESASDHILTGDDTTCGLVDAGEVGRREGRIVRAGDEHASSIGSGNRFGAHSSGAARESRPGPTNGFWGAADWLLCRPEPGYPNGRWRPVEPGTFPLAHGYSKRVPLLRLAGDAIVLPQAEAFVEACIEELIEIGYLD